MSNIEQKFHDEIEVERMWVATGQGKYAFLCMLPVSMLLVFGLWGIAPHSLLVFWFALLTVINLIRWMIMHYYHTHKHALIANIRRFKRIILFYAAVAGLCWMMSIVWFLEPSDPANVLIISITLIIEVVGSMLTWFCYFPAVIALSFPAALALVSQLFFQDDTINIAASLNLLLLTLFGATSSVKLAEMLNYALRLNFENLALRQETEEKSLLLETALENMGQGISMSDKDDRLRMWNRQFTDLLGTAGAKVANNVNLSSLLDAADPPLAVRSKGWTEYRLQDGQVYEIRQAELEQGGRVLTYTDITDLNKREQALEKARKEAEQANTAKTRFLAAASHDLRQPIHALGLFFAELSDRVHSPETAMLIGQIEDSIAAINSMLNALLDVSKLDAGVVKPAIEPFGLTELFARLKAEFQPIALENLNELRIRPALAIVNTDPAMLERMLRNLIGNALHYTESGRILVAARPRGQNIEIQIFDNGRGIPEDQLDEIFIEFHQLQNPARDRRQGLGLGLAIVKRLAMLLHHEIKVVSRLGRGSCFSITLPLARVTAASEPGQLKRANRPNYSFAGRQVLVLDDDNAVLESMKGLLIRWGCQVTTASSPAEAVDKLAAAMQRLDLLIIDYRLPENVSGIDVARNMQTSLDYPFAVLIITGDTGPERLREADASGYPLLHKPVQPAKLRSTLQYLMSKMRPVTPD
jgi:signal transduction histidine kinase